MHRRSKSWWIGILMAAGLGTPGWTQSSLGAFLGKTRILGALTKDNLTVTAVLSEGGESSSSSIKTLDEVMPTGKLVITETSKDGTVNTILLRNNSDHMVFVMAGEILSGAKQDRILQQDVLLAPRAQPIAVAAFCVEHGRWNARSASFDSERMNAPVSVRQQAKGTASQGAVWSAVAQNNAGLAAGSSSGTLASTYKTGRMVTERDPYVKALEALRKSHPSATGVVVQVNGKVVCADLFGDSSLLWRLWPKLMDSYIAEAIRLEKEKPAGPATPEALLALTTKASLTLGEGTGIGKVLHVTGTGVKGSGIALTAPVHVDLFSWTGDAAHTASNQHLLSSMPLIRNQ